MANKTLLYSSLLFGTLQLFFLFLNPPLILTLVIVCGTLTSIWNHGSTSQSAKRIDRLVMSIGAAIDACYAAHLPWSLLLLFMAILSYAIAKLSKSNVPHVLAHALLTLAHLSLCLSMKT
jgi:hypothetical protein